MRNKKRIALLLGIALLLSGCGARSTAHSAQPVSVREVQAASASVETSGGEAEYHVRTRLPYCYTILVTGVDDAGGGSDTNLLARVDAPNKRIDLVSLPRDTLLHTERHSNKLNYAYASGGIKRLVSDVERLLGVPVDYYVKIDLDGFTGLIDRIGGVDFDIPVDMDYDDPAQDLHIHFSKGARRLSGKQAMEVVRWRRNNDGTGYPNADIGRIATQQAFLKAAAEKALKIKNAPVLAQTFFTYVETDLSAGNLAWLAATAMDVGTEGLFFHALPGNGAGWYRGESVYVLDPDATLSLVNDALNPYNAPIRADELDILVP